MVWRGGISFKTEISYIIQGRDNGGGVYGS
jgi:hypothetical protein